MSLLPAVFLLRSLTPDWALNLNFILFYNLKVCYNVFRLFGDTTFGHSINVFNLRYLICLYLWEMYIHSSNISPFYLHLLLWDSYLLEFWILTHILTYLSLLSIFFSFKCFLLLLSCCLQQEILPWIFLIILLSLGFIYSTPYHYYHYFSF